MQEFNYKLSRSYQAIPVNSYQKCQDRGRHSYKSGLSLIILLGWITLSAAASTIGGQSTVASADKNGSGNIVVQLVVYLKDSVVKTSDSCAQLWKNYGKCQSIRKQQSIYREKVAEQWELHGLYSKETRKQIQSRLSKLKGGMSYADYVFLQKGKDDRGKVMNLAFLMWGAPRFLPYALMFNPDMLPSPFTSTNNPNHVGLESPMQRISRERATIFLQALGTFEHQVKAGIGGGFLSKINVFGKKKQAMQQQSLADVYSHVRELFRAGLSSPDPLLEKLENVIYREGAGFDRSEERLSTIPACLVQGIGQVIAGKSSPGILSSLQPQFMRRGQVLTHIKKVTEADDFLVETGVELDTIPPRLLTDACSDRMVGGPDWDADELRQGLREWLNLVAIDPVNRMKSNKELHYNGNVARLAMMGYGACQGAKGIGRIEPTLPQLLFSQEQKVNVTEPTEEVEKRSLLNLKWGR